MYLAMLYSLRSAPSARNYCRYEVAKVLSTTGNALAAFEIPAMSITLDSDWWTSPPRRVWFWRRAAIFRCIQVVEIHERRIDAISCERDGKQPVRSRINVVGRQNLVAPIQKQGKIPGRSRAIATAQRPVCLFKRCEQILQRGARQIPGVAIFVVPDFTGRIVPIRARHAEGNDDRSGCLMQIVRASKCLLHQSSGLRHRLGLNWPNTNISDCATNGYRENTGGCAVVRAGTIQGFSVWLCST